ncbi:MAG TPA: hypothetical protein VGF34_03620 [Stellaceae bacterium]
MILQLRRTSGKAVAFGGGKDVLTVDAGAVFTGAVKGGGGDREDCARLGRDSGGGRVQRV